MILEDLFHGTPHKFDRFSTKHIRSGEGANSYGWGLYFASQREVAEYYRDQVSASHSEKNQYMVLIRGKPTNVIRDIDDDPMLYGANRLLIYSFDPEQAIADVEESIHHSRGAGQLEFYKKVLRLLRSKTFCRTIKPITVDPQLYHVHVPDSNEFLLWDSSLKDQSPLVQKVLIEGMEMVKNKFIWKKTETNNEAVYRLYFNDNDLASVFEVKFDPDEPAYFALIVDNQTVEFDSLARAKIQAIQEIKGGTFYKTIFGGRDFPELTSRRLSQQKIAGIKYLDQHSRGRSGTYNYVIFDEGLVKITQRDSVPSTPK